MDPNESYWVVLTFSKGFKARPFHRGKDRKACLRLGRQGSIGWINKKAVFHAMENRLNNEPVLL